MIKLKELLCDIVKQAYLENLNEKYLKFYIELSPKDSKSMHGFYRYKDRHIVIYNTYRDDEAILCTTVHELAHHVDFCNRGKSDHQKEFYEVYEKLLFTAMDMGIIHKEKFLLTNKDASDSNKIRKMMEKYHPNTVDYKKDMVIISFTNCFEYKDYLKSKGYSYNSNTKAWEKEVADIDTEMKSLKPMPGIGFSVNKATEIHFNAGSKSKEVKRNASGGKVLIATGNTYEYRDALKNEGFKWDTRTKTWQYHILEDGDKERFEKLFPHLTFK